MTLNFVRPREVSVRQLKTWATVPLREVIQNGGNKTSQPQEEQQQCEIYAKNGFPSANALH